MKKDLLLLLDNALAFILGAMLVLLAVAAMYMDVNIFQSSMAEESFTEAMQEFLLLIMVVTYTYMARKQPKMRSALVLVAGFFACMFWREMDYWLGLIGLHWLPFVVVTAGVCIFPATKRPAEAARGLALFSETKPFTLLMTGLLTILVFSRLFGMKIFWVGLLGEDYPRWVKVFAEESVELFGYIQCFLGSFFYALEERRKKRAYSDAAATLLVSGATERMTS